MCGNGAVKPRLVEASGTIPVIYADGPASVEIHGSTSRLTFFEYRTIDGETVRVPVAEIVMPAAACGSGAVVQMTREARLHGRSDIDERAGETAH